MLGIKEKLMAGKDVAVSSSIKGVVNLVIKEFGKMLDLRLDSKNKRIFAEVELLGEKEPVSIEVGEYELVERDGKSFLVVKDLSASREWLDIVLKNHFNTYELELPPQIAKTLKIIV
jgi:hypothetical protein